MRPEIVAAVLRRGDHRCAWCACRLDTGRIADQGTVCRLDVSESASSMVASCIACANEYAACWIFTYAYTIANARRILGRCDALQSGPFVDYLERICKFDPNIPERAKRGYQTPFSTALARIEAQRNAPLELRQTRAA